MKTLIKYAVEALLLMAGTVLVWVIFHTDGEPALAWDWIDSLVAIIWLAWVIRAAYGSQQIVKPILYLIGSIVAVALWLLFVQPYVGF